MIPNIFLKYKQESLTAVFLLCMFYCIYQHPPGGGLVFMWVTVWANQGMILALVAMAQFFCCVGSGARFIRGIYNGTVQCYGVLCTHGFWC